VRLRVGRVALVGTSRAVTLESGLNVVLGDFTTGKTSFMRLLRVLLGSDYDGIIPEVVP
jgi:predicted ATPase